MTPRNDLRIRGEGMPPNDRHRVRVMLFGRPYGGASTEAHPPFAKKVQQDALRTFGPTDQAPKQHVFRRVSRRANDHTKQKLAKQHQNWR